MPLSAAHRPTSSLLPDTEGASDVYVVQNQDGSWGETTDKGDFEENDIPYWSPIFLDKGELTFDTSGTLVSPLIFLCSAERRDHGYHGKHRLHREHTVQLSVCCTEPVSERCAGRRFGRRKHRR